MPRSPGVALVLSLLCCCGTGSAQEGPAAARRPIRALLVVGGCCHDYARQKLILTKGISARADVEWTVVHQGGTATDSKIPLYEDADWAKGFDVVVHNECFSDAKEVEWVERVLKPHRDGVPAVLIHCAMHCYRSGTDRWFEFCGIQSPGHGPHHGYKVENLKPDHPIMVGVGDTWNVAKGELYDTTKLFPTATPLAQARRQADNQPQACVWTNQYGQTRVFCTTIGHYNETMADPTYLDMITRGLLWAVNRLDDAAIRKTSTETNDAITAILTAPLEGSAAQQLPPTCCGEGNLVFSKPTSASSEETGQNNFARHAVDANLTTRWCANGPRRGELWQVDLGKPEQVRSLRIHWEGQAAYRYRVDASANATDWQTIVDESRNRDVARITPHEVDAPDTRYLRVTFLGSSTGGWGSLWEFEAYKDKLPDLPAGVGAASSPSPTVSDVQAPDGFEVTLFGTPPIINYPVCLSAAPTGELFVGVDEQGSLGKEKDCGRVLRCLDVDGDGRADRVNTFAEMDHPRGLIYDNGSLWVLHPPTLSVFHDDDRDGYADRHEVLVTGLSTEQVEQRGADHTTNGIRLGIDGWIYIAVGDFGFADCTGADGRSLSRRGGGVLRVRPDGTELEVFAWGLRNIVDVCVDPFLNVFTRDNTNDGGGWDIRVSHVLRSAEYGYPSLYVNFADEIMPPLAQYGGGSGCGGMYFQDLRWPAPYADALYTCDWGTNEIYRHNLAQSGPTFAAHQEVFAKVPRPTDIDVDGRGLMYVASWKNGEFSYKGPDVGFVAQVRPRNFLPQPFPDLASTDDAGLIRELSSPSAVHRLHNQRELLRRGPDQTRSDLLAACAGDTAAPLHGRVAAIFTLKQLDGVGSHATLLNLVNDPLVREFALRALTDRATQLDALPLEPFLAALHDDECLSALEGPYRDGALRVLHCLHDKRTIDGLLYHLAHERNATQRQQLLATLIRLYHREGDYDGRDWWGTRPDTTGPYYDRKTWPQSERIAGVIRDAVRDSKGGGSEAIQRVLAHHKVRIDGIDVPLVDRSDEPQVAIAVPQADPSNPHLLANLAYDTAVERALKSAGDVERGRQLYTQQSCAACHTDANGQTPKGPHLVDIGKRYKHDELIESLLKPSARIAQGFDSWVFLTTEGAVHEGFVARESAESIHVRRINGLALELLKSDVEERKKLDQSMMPAGIVGNLTPEQLADLLAYLDSLRGP